MNKGLASALIVFVVVFSTPSALAYVPEMFGGETVTVVAQPYSPPSTPGGFGLFYNNGGGFGGLTVTQMNLQLTEEDIKAIKAQLECPNMISDAMATCRLKAYLALGAISLQINLIVGRFPAVGQGVQGANLLLWGGLAISEGNDCDKKGYKLKALVAAGNTSICENPITILP